MHCSVVKGLLIVDWHVSMNIKLSGAEVDCILDGLITVDYLDTEGRDREPDIEGALETVTNPKAKHCNHGELVERLMLMREATSWW